MNKLLECVVSESARLDQALARAFPEISRSRFQALIAEGRVAVEGMIATDRGLKIKSGARVSVAIPEPTSAKPEPETIPLQVLFEDKDIVVIDKPAGLTVHPGAGQDSGTLVNALLAHCGDSLSGVGGVKRPGIVHRLDKDTSGVMIVAKNDAAHKHLSEQFASHGRDGRLQRTYLAFVWGAPQRSSGTISAALARSTTNRKKIAVSKGAAGRAAITHFKTLKMFGNPPRISLLSCQLETGRTHQIRVHMAHIGHPLLGDRTYGSGFAASARALPAPARDALNALNRQALHAASLGFEHPRTGKPMLFESPLPPELQRLLDVLHTAL
ncbi:MAG: RluA family pseudouridine synthase [Rhizobiales bacterium]|nr:RluA family pseudouridine synthase [Hyphomicrobiales bacterium]